MTISSSDTVLILGGRSDIGQAIARRFAKAGASVVLAARSVADLEPDRADIALRHEVSVDLAEFDVLDTGAMADFVAGLDPAPSVVVCVVGAMGEQDGSEQDPAAAALVMRSNYEGPALILGLFANQMAEAGQGALVGVSSVAGDRGRATNYVYGSAKAGFTAFLSGLRNRLASGLLRPRQSRSRSSLWMIVRMMAPMRWPKSLAKRTRRFGCFGSRKMAVRQRRAIVGSRKVQRLGSLCWMQMITWPRTALHGL